jgi:glucose-1-phosphatase
MTFNLNRYIAGGIGLLVALLLVACSPRLAPGTGEAPVSEAFMVRPDGFSERYALEEMVILSRHNIRSPISGPGSVLSRITPHEWFPWTSAPGELSLKGGALEAEMGQFFREWLVKEGFFPKYAVPEEGTVRFYANSIQRTRATARMFAAGMFPMADITVEQHAPLGTMDPVFNPQITKDSDVCLHQAMDELLGMGSPDGPLRSQYALLEKVLDIKDSPAGRNDTTAFSAFPVNVSFLLHHEPGMQGGLRMACVASDALTLQYYEEPDDRKAAFGHSLTRKDWEAIASIKDRYQDILFGLPTMAVNVAHPMLQELLSELREPGRKFTFLCGHDSNIGSVLAALRAEPYSAPGAIEAKTPIGGKIVFGKYRGRDGRMYADLWLVYASADQLRGLAVLGPDCPPMSLPLRLAGLTPNADGLYLLSDLEARFTEAIDLYETF